MPGAAPTPGRRADAHRNLPPPPLSDAASVNGGPDSVDDLRRAMKMRPSSGVCRYSVFATFLALSGACGTRDPGRPPPPPPDAADLDAGAGVDAADAAVDDDGAPPADLVTPPDAALADYFPFAVGNVWEYNVTPAGGLSFRKLHRIVRLEKVGGEGPSKDLVAARVETLKKTSAGSPTVNDASISWQLRQGAEVLRYRETSCTMGSATLNGDGSAIDNCSVDVEDSWSPPRPRLDERPMGQPLAQGMTWQAVYTESKITYSYADPSMPIAIRTSKQEDDQWRVLEADVRATVPAGTFDHCVILEKRSQSAAVKTYTFCRGVGKVKEVGEGQTEELATLPTLR